MRLPLPSTGDITQLLTAVPRLLALIESAERVVARADGLIDRIETTRLHADDVASGAQDVVDRAAALIVRTAGVVGSAEPSVERASRILDGWEPVLDQLRPMVQRLASSTDAREVDALVRIVDQLPAMISHVEDTVVPTLAALQSVAPDVHDLLDMTRELNAMIAKLPVLGRIKKRVDEEQADD